MSVQRRNKIIIDLQITYTGYKVVEPLPDASRRTRITSFRPEPTTQRRNWPVDLTRNLPQVPMGQILATQSHANLPVAHLTLPVSTAWFDINKVHQIQRKALPEFFLKPSNEYTPFKKSQRLYRYYRNTIIGMWRENTKKYLPPSACRRNLLGDVCAIVRVHAFLENWGIINFPSKEIKGPLVKRETLVECHVCGNKHYKLHVYEEPEITFCVCSKCFEDQLYPKFMASESFRIVDIDKPKEDDWTPAETLKLLELLQQSRDKDNWAQICKQFPTRSKQQVVMHFLKTPALRLSKSASIFQNGQDIKDPPNPSYPPTIFGDYRNPIQIACAVLLKQHSQNPTQQTIELMDILKLHTQYLLKKEQTKLDKQMKLLTDLSMNKVECKVVYLHQYSLLIQSLRKNIEQLVPNQIAEIMKQAMR